MGLITDIFGVLFGSGKNVVKDTVEVFRPNAEAQSKRGFDLDSATLNQMAAEFADRENRGRFDRLMDGVNRLPRPMLVLGVFGILVWTSVDPIAAAQVFTSWAIIPTEFWYVVLAIVTFYFGGRYQTKVHQMQARLANVAAGVPAVLQTISELEDLRADIPVTPGVADPGPDASVELAALQDSGNDNPALADWEADWRARK
ncbi:3TM-type holin [Profundibacter sp.]